MANPRVPFELPSADRLRAMEIVRDHAARGALAMIDWANHKPENRGRKPKVGGHQASSMSSVDLLCALYLHCRRPWDRVAVKPHAAPVIYSLMHLMGELGASELDRLRELGGPQPYPTKLKAPLYIDYTSSSEALGVSATIYDGYGAVLQNRSLRAAGAPEIRSIYWAHCGDGELTEGQIDESLYDAGRWGLGNVVWIVDLNRQSLDRVMDDSGRLGRWARAKFEGHGWRVSELRWGQRARALFERPGGEVLQRLLDAMDDVFHPLLLLGGAELRAILLEEPPSEGGDEAFGHLRELYSRRWTVSEEERAAVARAIEDIDDSDLARALGHLGGHDLGALCASLQDAAGGAADERRPAVVIAHTVKGYETSHAAHPENHGMLLDRAEVLAWGSDRGLPPGVRYPRPVDEAAQALCADRARELFAEPDHTYLAAPVAEPRASLAEVRLPQRRVTSTGEAFQSLNVALMRSELGPWLHFAAPDVGSTTHLAPIIKQTGVFAPRELEDPWRFLRDRRLSSFDFRPSTEGQFHALGIAEGNAMLWAYAFGRQKKAVEGRVPLWPVVTVYDKFFERGFNQLDYALYSAARFVAVGVPSGTGLSREAATHQSLQTLRMIMDLPGIAAYEPAFGADVHAIYLHALGQLHEPEGEAIYLRLSTQPLDQPTTLPGDHAAQAVAGAWWLLGEDERDGERGLIVLVASGRKLQQAREAARLLGEEHGVGSRILNVTSYEALWRGWDAWASEPERWDDPDATYHLHRLFDDERLNAPMILVGDHVPSVAEWLPTALHRVRSARFLGPRRNGEAGDLEAVDRLHGMAASDIVEAALAELRWRESAGL